MAVQHILQSSHGTGLTARNADISLFRLFIRVMQHLVRHRARKQDQKIRIPEILQTLFRLGKDLCAAVVRLAQVLISSDHSFIPADNYNTHICTPLSLSCLSMLAFVSPYTPSLIFYFFSYFFDVFVFSFSFKLAYANHQSKEKCLSAFTFASAFAGSRRLHACRSRFPLMLCFDLFCLVAGPRHCTMCAVTATGGFSFFLVLDKTSDNRCYDQHQHQRYDDGTQILCDPV